MTVSRDLQVESIVLGYEDTYPALENVAKAYFGEVKFEIDNIRITARKNNVGYYAVAIAREIPYYY